MRRKKPTTLSESQAIKGRVERQVERATKRRLERAEQIKKLKKEGFVIKGKTPNIKFNYKTK